MDTQCKSNGGGERESCVCKIFLPCLLMYNVNKMNYQRKATKLNYKTKNKTEERYITHTHTQRYIHLGSKNSNYTKEKEKEKKDQQQQNIN